MGTNAVGHARQCAAHSSRTKERCRKFAIRGARTCRSHGSAASHVRRAARLRIAALVDPSLDVLLKTLRPGGRHVNPETQLRAARDVLDRNGLTALEEPIPAHYLAPSPPTLKNLCDEELDMLVNLLRKAAL
jgi:hypothetical protein